MLLVEFYPGARMMIGAHHLGGFLVTPENHWKEHLENTEKTFGSGNDVLLCGTIRVSSYEEYLRYYKVKPLDVFEAEVLIGLFGTQSVTTGVGLFSIASISNMLKEELCESSVH